MLPKIARSRSTLWSLCEPLPDGAQLLVLSKETYPELFELAHPEIVQKAQSGWRPTKSGHCRRLIFPAGSLSEEEIEEISEWCKRFRDYVLIGLNSHHASNFDAELDFCLALGYNYDLEKQCRTALGEMEYQLKYKESDAQLEVASGLLAAAYHDLPLSAVLPEKAVVTHIPALPRERNVGRSLAQSVSSAIGLEFTSSDLLRGKPAMKDLPLSKKLEVWQNLYQDSDHMRITGTVSGRIVLIIDDLYQSGTSMWSFAKWLKSAGAKQVLGLVCVKSMRDSDNQ